MVAVVVVDVVVVDVVGEVRAALRRVARRSRCAGTVPLSDRRATAGQRVGDADAVAA